MKSPDRVKQHQFVQFLEDTLIPDLRDSGKNATADDFVTAVRYITELEDEIVVREAMEHKSNVATYTDETRPLIEMRGDGHVLNVEIVVKPGNVMGNWEMDKIVEHMRCIVRAYDANCEYIHDASAVKIYGVCEYCGHKYEKMIKSGLTIPGLW